MVGYEYVGLQTSVSQMREAALRGRIEITGGEDVNHVQQLVWNGVVLWLEPFAFALFVFDGWARPRNG